MNDSKQLQNARLYRKIGYVFFLFLIAWTITAASIGVYRGIYMPSLQQEETN